MRYLLGVVVTAIGLYLLTGFVQVRPGERAVVRRFGQVVATPGPGLWVGLPWGIDRVDRVPVDLVRPVKVGYSPDEDDTYLESPPGQLLTGDHNLVNVQVVLHYAVDDDGVVPFLEQQDRVDGLIARAAETVLAQWVAGRAIDDILLEGKSVLPGVLVRETQERMEPYHLGVQVRDADVTHLYPPREVKHAFDEVNQAQTAITTREHEARQDADRVLREAATEKYRIEQRTAAYTGERLRLAKAEADRFEKRLEQYARLRRENPNFLAGIWWDEMGKLFASLKANGRVELLDHHLGKDGMDITVFPPYPKKK